MNFTFIVTMKAIHKMIGGFTGALALNILHQAAARITTDAPRVDLVGEEALNKGLQAVGAHSLQGDQLFEATLAADIVSNSIYFSMIGNGENKNLLARGAGIGLAAGIGALTLTKPMGLDDSPVNKKRTTQLMTVAWYTIGGVVAALTMKMLDK
ncbi:MAG: hypothetical protein ABIR15_05910 [Chitinophagaceae bacterium]